MNTKTSSRAIKTIFADDIRRWWKFSLGGFIIIALGILIVILHIHNGDDVQNIHNYMNLVIWIPSLAFPVAAAMGLFSYLHTKGPQILMHSLPVSRKSMFLGHACSGLLLSSTPVLLGILVLLIMSQTGLCQEANGYAASDVLYLFSFSIDTLLGCFVFCTLAAMIAGTSFMQLLLTLGLSVIIPLFALFIGSFGQYFLTGFYSLSSMTPLTNMIYPQGGIYGYPAGWIRTLIFYALIMYLAYVLYQRRPLENAGSSYIFSKPTPWETGIISICATAAILTFTVGKIDNPLIIIGIAIAIYLLISLPIYGLRGVCKKQNMKELGIFTCIIIIIAASFAVDILGFEKNLPDTSKVESAHIDCGAELCESLGIDNSYMDNIPGFTTPEAIGAVLELNKDVAEASSPDRRGFSNGRELTFNYHMKSGAKLTRTYYIANPSSLDIMDDLNSLREADGYKEMFLLENNRLFYDDDYSCDLSISIEPFGHQESEDIMTDDSKGLIKAIDKDYLDRSLEQELSHDVIGIITFENGFGDHGGWYIGNIDELHRYPDYATVYIHLTDVNTIKWLKEHDYYDILDPSDLMIEKISILKMDYENEDYSKAATIRPDELGVASYSEYIEKYGQIDSYDYDENDTYEINIYLKNRRTGNYEERYLECSGFDAPSYFKKLKWEKYD